MSFDVTSKSREKKVARFKSFCIFLLMSSFKKYERRLKTVLSS